MDLRDYPRPKGDTGIGVHWSPAFPNAVGLGQIRDFWLPELQALGVKWVKLARHDGGLELAELLLKHDIMPIVRLYRLQPNPGTLDEMTLRAVKDYVSAGVRYFEFNNEPDLGVEWQNARVPSDAMAIVAGNAILDMEAILAAGGYPGVPAVAVGTKWDLVGEICRLGRRDLLAQPVWQAIHNYSLNHPLDYPYDTGNQKGAAYTQDFYNRLASEQWEGRAWGELSLEQVNQERREHKNPGATAFDDPSCWRAYERYDNLIRAQIGRSLPILATENGYAVGERFDPRYPATTPQLHGAQTLEACRCMMGSSTRFDHAPDFYFCTAYWLLANYNLGSWAAEWEGQAWYSGRWPGGRLPAIEALKAEPKQARPWRGDGGIAGRVGGAVRGGVGATVKLERADGWVATTQIGTDERYEIIDVPLASYRISIVEARQSQDVTPTNEQPSVTVNFDLSGVALAFEKSIVRGRVTGGAGQTLRLTRDDDGWTQDLIVPAGGLYRFTGLRAGVYTLALVGTEIVQGDIVLDGRDELTVDLAALGWGWEITDGGVSPGFGVVRCRVTGRMDQAVRLWTAGWEGNAQRTGSKREYGPDVCEFAPLGAGRYQVQIDGVDVVADVLVDGSRVTWLTFTEGTPAPPPTGAVVGTVTGGGGRTVRLFKPPAKKPVAETQATDAGAYRFEDLQPGVYTLQVLEAGLKPTVAAEQTDVTVEAGREAQVDLSLAEPESPLAGLRWSVEDGGEGPGFSVVRCRVIGGAGRAVSLWTWGWGGVTQVAGSKPEYGPDACEFAPLGSGLYFVELEERANEGSETITVRAEVNLAANRVAWVRFEWVETPEPPTPPPAQSVIAGAVINGEGRLVLLSGPAGELQATVEDGRYRFEGLAAGVYRIAIAADDPALGDLATSKDVVVDGVDQVAVNFDLSEPPVPVDPIEPPTPPTPPVPPDPPARAESKIQGRVRGGAGRTVVLEGPLPAGGEGIVGSQTTVVAADESYTFIGLKRRNLSRFRARP